MKPSVEEYNKANGARIVSPSAAPRRTQANGNQPETPQGPSNRTKRGPLGHHRG